MSDLSCPKGGNFYICAGNATEFIGCCNSNPCTNGGKCPSKDLVVSSFSLDVYSAIKQQDCDVAAGKNDWYTCKNEGTNSFPFIGCCASNPCEEPDGLCPKNNLVPAKLSSDPVNRAFFAEKVSSTTPSPSASSTPGSSGGGLATGAIVGIAIGAAVAVGLIIAVIWRCGWHARKRNERRQPKWEAATQAGHPEMGFASTPQSPSPYEPSRSPIPYDPARESYATTAVPGSYASSSPPHSPYYPMKHMQSPPMDDHRMSTYTDSNVSSMTGHGYAKHPLYAGPPPELHPVSELDGVEHPHPKPTAPPAPLAELGDGTPANPK
ncbi:hypothetical protein CkaCkLH20_07162 [Colletotrichum karsti]|uniref:Carcinoembryonic antigen-related cell adhesion molecule 1 n=1 Tax=Colletotrichum karsti TaxID=1095194 RepID=A0A9P6LK78_9PEZI|nr:uncharacterized protein CkaCkLH20_07162 [Colletotrichum karsti]KAF9875342.1 hypothetical protein CkaCkLH20_07162 [Colletotrichum karsti]